ncbi:Histone deacetylase hda1 [Mortierella sp. GBA43]|nr:Histone deacetylase hda1 [Mortierella sp. GBA43]
MTDRLTTLSTTIITADPSQVERDMAVASDPITTDSNNVETTEVIPNIGAATVTGEHMFKSTDESASSLPPLKDMNKVDAEHGDDDTVSGAYMNPDRESPTTEVATHEDAGQESTEADSFTGAQEYTQTKQDIDVKEEGVVTEDMDVDTGVAVGPDDPIWIDEDEYDGPPLQQPETFQGRSTKTGYVYDVRMKHHNNVHGDDDHPEDPRRIWRIFDALNTAQCTDRMIKIPTREATAEELSLVHTENHIENITKTAGMNKDDLFAAANNYNSIYLNNSSAFCARLSCGSLIELCRAVALGQVLNGLAIIRPPGHHAEPDEAGGFCLFNNVAIAARYLQKCHGLQKIFILDWDVHHGNGTQSAFYDDPDVVYCSIHRFDHGTFYPGDPIAGAHTAIGEGKGRGRTINIPWNSSGMGDSEYLYAFHKVIIPIIYEFAPDFVLVSAGFDAAEGDHIGQMLVTPAAYGHMTHMLKSLAGGKIILALEGGYNLDSIAVSGLACAKALLNDPIKPLDPIVPNALCVQTIHEVIEVQSPYWRSLPQAYTAPVNDPIESHLIIGVDKILSSYRQSYLQEKHDMIRVPKLESDHMSDFLDNVLCTQRTFGTKPLYIFIHDLSEEISIRTLGTSSTVRTDKSIMVDTVSQYVDYIIDSGNELIDIVVPYQPTTEDERTALKEKLTGLLAEIWDNYVSTTGYTGRKIVLLAAGFGCHSMTAFINERQKEVVKYVSCVTLVPGDDILLPMVTKKMGPWYFDNSFVILADDHPYWEKAPKANNRTGTLIRSDSQNF